MAQKYIWISYFFRFFNSKILANLIQFLQSIWKYINFGSCILVYIIFKTVIFPKPMVSSFYLLFNLSRYCMQGFSFASTVSTFFSDSITRRICVHFLFLSSFVSLFGCLFVIYLCPWFALYSLEHLLMGSEAMVIFQIFSSVQLAILLNGWSY
jgi:hypothetical protein